MTDIIHIPLESIIVNRSDRQRREIDVADLIPSIKRLGVLNPVILSEGNVLVAGERRLEASRQLGLTHIPARLFDQLSPMEKEMVELDENLRREELPWQDKARAVERMYTLYKLDNPGASVASFSDQIGYAAMHVARFLDAAEQLRVGNERVAQAPTLVKAVNVIARQNERATNNALAEIMDNVSLPPSVTARPEFTPPPSDDILNEDFTKWAASYSGEKFNLIHCDFPYGVNLQDSDQIADSGHVAYEDSEEVYWNLFRTLATHQDRIISSSAHMIFWYSMKFHNETTDFLARNFPAFTFEELPLVWWKTDNKGIAPDVQRRPRRVYETALFGWRGDRKIVKLVANCYGAPKANSSHVSEKPEPVLKHFFSMVVDSSTRLLDPTCGSGSAIRAAEALGASRVLGLELDPSHAEDAKAKLKAFRSIEALRSKTA